MQLACTSHAEQRAHHVRHAGYYDNVVPKNFYTSTDLLIDISDALQICCYELGRTYLKLSQALCINVPSIGESKNKIFIESFLIY